MFVGRVMGSLIATQKTEAMVGHKLLLVEPHVVDLDTRTTLKTTGRTYVTIDTVGAGAGEYVLVCQGSSARLTPETKHLPVDAVIIGIVDSVRFGSTEVYSKEDEE